MRILHTADVHLRADRPRTVDALETLIEEADRQNADVLTVAGDLFHSAADADALRPTLRSRLSDTGLRIVVSPGNHDAEVFQQNLDFGADVEVLRETPVDRRHVDAVTVLGVPYTDELTETVFSALADGEPQEGQERAEDAGTTRVLLLHCTLDVGFGRGTSGEDEPTSYFPVTRGTLGSLDVDFVLAGHIHASTRQVPLSNGGVFVYPGSPVSHSRTETGRRHAVLVDTGEETVESVPLETYYVDRLDVTVRPGGEDEVLDRIDSWAGAREEPFADLEVAVDGFTEWEEDEFGNALAAVTGSASLTNEVRGARQVLDHQLYRQFLEAFDPETAADPEGVRTRVIEVLSRLLANREIRP